jgi:hypothetical protein
MKCVICKHGETRPGKTTVTLDRGGSMEAKRRSKATLIKDTDGAKEPSPSEGSTDYRASF